MLNNQDALALMPTGGGKSLCFQVPTLCRPGICLVISPLIALMKDQVQQLQKRGIQAVAIYAGMHYREIDRLLDNCIYGEVKFLYLSPERLLTPLAQERIRRMNVSLIAVDEAHCISQWGYDFRPPYLQIGAFRQFLPDAPVLALTATATPEVVIDIQEKLLFRKGTVFQKSFARQNLAYVVRETEAKEEHLLRILQRVPGSSVVYVRNRRRTREVALFLQRQGIPAGYYHAGLNPEQRSKRQDAWLNGQLRVMVSTNAFGMGIDKPDVRTVVHLELPDSLEAYFQEAGRAGRDGLKSYAVLLYHDQDRQQLERQFTLAYPGMEELRRVYRALGSHYQLAVGSGSGEGYDFDLAGFCQTYSLDPIHTYHCLKVLEQEGWLILTEAVFVPSSMKMLVDKDKLYDYQLRHPALDKLLKSILRSYQGSFTEYFHIRESRLAQFLNHPLEQVHRGLEMLNKDGIIDYHPQRDQPQLIFLQERVAAENLQIDLQQYNFRKNRHLERIRAAVGYATTALCRSQQLLRYFDDKSPQACGICDVCLDREKAETLSNSDLTRYQQKIERLLSREPLTIPDILACFAPKFQESILKTLHYLLDEGFLQEHEGLITLPQSGNSLPSHNSLGNL